MTAFSDAFDTFKYLEIPQGDFDIVSVATKWCPLLGVIAAGGRQRLDGAYVTPFGVGEKFWPKGTTYAFKEYGEFTSFFTANATHNTVVTTITLVSTVGIVPGAILQNIVTNEQVRVTSITNATDLVVIRGYGTTAADAWAAAQGVVLVSVSTAYGEVGAVSLEKSATPRTNYFQKITTTIKRTDLDNFLANELSGLQWENAGNTRDIWVNDKMLEHAKQIEKALLLSQKYWDAGTSTGTPEGVIELAKRNSGGVSNISGGATLVAFVAAIKSLFKAGDPQTRYVLYGEDCASVLASMVDSYTKEKSDLMPIDGVDLRFTQLTLVGGQVLRFMQHPYMETKSGFGGYAVVLDPSQLKIVWSEGQTVMGEPLKGTTRLTIVSTESNYAKEQYDIVSYFSMHNANCEAHRLIRLV
jgi:hypothetical protein